MVEILGSHYSCHKCGKTGNEIETCEDCNGLTFVDTVTSSARRLLDHLSSLSGRSTEVPTHTHNSTTSSLDWCAICSAYHAKGEHIEGGGNKGTSRSREKDQKENHRGKWRTKKKRF